MIQQQQQQQQQQRRNSKNHVSSSKSKAASRWMMQVESGIDQGSKSSSTNPSPAMEAKFRPALPVRAGGYSDSEAALDFCNRIDFPAGSYHANPMDAIHWDDEYSRSDSEGCGGSDTEDLTSSVYDNSPVYRPSNKLPSEQHRLTNMT